MPVFLVRRSQYSPNWAIRPAASATPVRVQRLRPGGSYTNWRLGLEHRRDRLTIGVDYIGTEVSRTATASRFADQRNAGDRIVGRIQVSF